MVYSNTAVYGGKWVWYIRSLAYFHFFEALYAFEVQIFQSFILHPITDTDSIYSVNIVKSEHLHFHSINCTRYLFWYD